MAIEWLVTEYERYAGKILSTQLTETPSVIYGWADLEWPGGRGQRVLRGPGHRYAVVTEDHRVMIFPNRYEVERGWLEMLAIQKRLT